MTKILSILSLLAVFVVSAIAQNVQPPTIKSAITNAGTWEVRPSDSTGAFTNIATAQANWCVVGKDGFGVAVKSYGTNAALTTNVFFIIEFTADGVNAITNNNVTVVYGPKGVATNTFYTNFVAGTATHGNIAAARLKSFISTNGVIGSSLAGTLFVEKFLILGR